MIDGDKAAKKLKEAREELGMSQASLAKLANLGLATITRLERDPKYWDTVHNTTLGKLSSALGAPRGFFSTDNDLKIMPEKNHPNAKLNMANEVKKDPHLFPRLAHMKEDWNDQGLCLIEHVRQVYWNWSNQEEPTLDGLLDAIDDTVVSWGHSHGYEGEMSHDDLPKKTSNDADDGSNNDHRDDTHDVMQYIQPSTRIFVKKRDIFSIDGWGISKKGNAAEHIAPGDQITTIGVVKDDGVKYLQIKVNDMTYFVRPDYKITSTDPADNLVALSPEYTSPMKSRR